MSAADDVGAQTERPASVEAGLIDMCLFLRLLERLEDPAYCRLFPRNYSATKAQRHKGTMKSEPLSAREGSIAKKIADAALTPFEISE